MLQMLVNLACLHLYQLPLVHFVPLLEKDWTKFGVGTKENLLPAQKLGSG